MTWRILPIRYFCCNPHDRKTDNDFWDRSAQGGLVRSHGTCWRERAAHGWGETINLDCNLDCGRFAGLSKQPVGSESHRMGLVLARGSGFGRETSALRAGPLLATLLHRMPETGAVGLQSAGVHPSRLQQLRGHECEPGRESRRGTTLRCPTNADRHRSGGGWQGTLSRCLPD